MAGAEGLRGVQLGKAHGEPDGVDDQRGLQ